MDKDFEKCLEILRKDENVAELLRVYNEKERELSLLKNKFYFDVSFSSKYNPEE